MLLTWKLTYKMAYIPLVLVTMFLVTSTGKLLFIFLSQDSDKLVRFHFILLLQLNMSRIPH